MKYLTAPDADIDPLSPEEITAFLAACPAWWRPYYTVAFWTGLRPNEAAALKRGDLDRRRASFRIRAGRYRGIEGTPKTKASVRDVDVLPPALAALDAQLAQQAAQRLRDGQGAPAAGQDYVFTGPEGALIDFHHLRVRVWLPALAKAGLRRRTHQTRDSFASNALEAGESPQWVARMLGHRNAKLLFERYAKWIPDPTRQDGSALAARPEPSTKRAMRPKSAPSAPPGRRGSA